MFVAFLVDCLFFFDKNKSEIWFGVLLTAMMKKKTFGWTQKDHIPLKWVKYWGNDIKKVLYSLYYPLK